MVVVDQQLEPLPSAVAGGLVEVDERAARRTLRAQVSRLERELSETVASSFGRTPLDVRVASESAGPRILSLGELESLRDALAAQLRTARQSVSLRSDEEQDARERLEKMLLAPGEHKFWRVSQRELGVRSCGVYEVRPRLGLIGMLAGWWHVKLSSGCPLAGG